MTDARVAFPELEARPVWVGSVPLCSYDSCPKYDGKRCELEGHRPDGICAPTTRALTLLHVSTVEAAATQARRSGQLLKLATDAMEAWRTAALFDGHCRPAVVQKAHDATAALDRVQEMIRAAAITEGKAVRKKR